MLNEVVKIFTKMISAGIDVKQEIKELVAVSYNFSQKCLLKIQCKTGFYF